MNKCSFNFRDLEINCAKIFLTGVSAKISSRLGCLNIMSYPILAAVPTCSAQSRVEKNDTGSGFGETVQNLIDDFGMFRPGFFFERSPFFWLLTDTK